MMTTAPATYTWHTDIDINGQPYPTRHRAEVDDPQLIDVTGAQLDYLRAIHEAGHAVAVLSGQGHLHSAQIEQGEHEGDNGGVVYACNLRDGHAYATYSAAGERAADHWMRETGLWTPRRAVVNEVAARSDRQSFLAINPNVGFGDREVDYRVVHDLADQFVNQHWDAITAVADALTSHLHLTGGQIADLAQLPNGTPSDTCITVLAA